MALEFQVLCEDDLDNIFDYAQLQLNQFITDKEELTFLSWAARWRREALAHYLPMGWSFVARDDEGVMVGFFLAQPLIFFRGQAQSLWVEHIETPDTHVRQALVDLAIRVAKEKHLQRVLFSDVRDQTFRAELDAYGAKLIIEPIAEIKTTKGF